jgi:hypothetical protein
VTSTLSPGLSTSPTSSSTGKNLLSGVFKTSALHMYHYSPPTSACSAFSLLKLCPPKTLGYSFRTITSAQPWDLCTSYSWRPAMPDPFSFFRPQFKHHLLWKIFPDHLLWKNTFPTFTLGPWVFSIISSSLFPLWNSLLFGLFALDVFLPQELST